MAQVVVLGVLYEMILVGKEEKFRKELLRSYLDRNIRDKYTFVTRMCPVQAPGHFKVP